MATSPTPNNAEKFFGTTETGGRTPKQDLTALNLELTSYKTREQLNSLRWTEGSAIKEFTDTLEKNMNSPNDCIVFYQAACQLFTTSDWQTESGLPALTIEQQNMILGHVQAIILAKMKSFGADISVDTARKEVIVQPADFFGSSTTLLDFLRSTGFSSATGSSVNSPNTIKRVQTALEKVRGAEKTAKSIEEAKSTIPKKIEPGAKGVLNTVGDRYEDFQRWVGNNTGTNDFRIDHPVIHLAGEGLVAGLLVYGLLKGAKGLRGLVKKKKASKKETTDTDTETPSPKKRMSTVKKVILFTALSALTASGIYGVKKYGSMMGILYGVRDSAGMAMDGAYNAGVAIKGKVDKWLKPAAPRAGPPRGPTSTPETPLNGLTGEKKTLREIMKNDIAPLVSRITAHAHKNELLKANDTPKKALTHLQTQNFTSLGISQDDYNKIQEALLKDIALEASIDKSSGNAAKISAADKLYCQLMPIGSMQPSFLNTSTVANGIIQTINNEIQAPLNKTADKALLAPIIHKCVTDICLRKIETLLQAKNNATPPVPITGTTQIFNNTTGTLKTYDGLRDLLMKLGRGDMTAQVAHTELSKIIHTSHSELNYNNTNINIGSIGSLQTRGDIDKIIPLINYLNNYF